MYGIRIHGRGGQGAKTAARIIGRACFLEGKETQDFAIYGSERRGAPVMGFVRIDDRKILERGYITHPDLVAVMDDTLFSVTNVLDGLGKGILLVNTAKGTEVKTKALVHTIDLTELALKETGHDIPDTAIAAAIAKISGIARLESILKAIEIELGRFEKEEIEKNKRLAQKAWEQVK